MVNLGSAITQGAVIAITIKGIDKFSNTFKKANTGTKILAKGFKVGALAVGAATLAMGALGVSVIKLAGDFEQTTVAFTTMLGSAEKAKVFLEELADFAKKTPFTLPGVEKSARQLLAVGFEAKQVLPVLKDVGNVASGLGLGEEGLQRLILNLGQVQSQGKLTGRELRDFAVAGVPILDELAKNLGKTTAEIKDLISAGKIETDDVIEAFRTMGSEGGRFANLMEKQALTVQGRFSNLKDTLTLLGREIGISVLPAVGDMADLFLNDLLPSLQPLIPLFAEGFVSAIETLAPLLPTIVDGLGNAAIEFLGLLDAIKPLVEPLGEIAGDILGIGTDLAGIFVEGIKGTIPELGGLLEILKPVIELLERFVTLLRRAQELQGFIKEKIGVPAFNIGGIPGAGFGPKLGGGGIAGGFPSIPEIPELPSAITGRNATIVNVSIGNVTGVDSEDISRALSDELSSKVSL